jgi:hypothetical protein
MRCHEFERLFADRAEAALSADARAHLADCARCADLARADVATDMALRRLAASQPQPDHELARRRLSAAIAAAPPPRRSFFDRFPLARPAMGLTAAGLAAAALVAGLALRPQAPTPVPEQVVQAPKAGGLESPIRVAPSHEGGASEVVRRTSPPDPLSGAERGRKQPRFDSPLPAPGRGAGGERSADQPAPARPRGDLDYLNEDPARALQRWARLPADEVLKLEEKLRKALKGGDDFVYVPLPRIADSEGWQIAAAIESYKHEATIVDPRLFRKVTLQFRAASLSELCDRLRADTGIHLAAGQSVADEKMTLFCKETPLRDVMRQMSRPFGYTWLRSGKEKEFRYELVQDLRSQLAEEELRNRDRHAALVALDREIARYRRYLLLSPDEARARAKSAEPSEKRLLEALGGYGWGPVQLYFRLSPGDLSALRAGQTLVFSAEPGPGEHRLPQDLARGVLQSMRDWRLYKRDDAFHVNDAAHATEDGQPPAVVPEARARVRLSLKQSELGQFVLDGRSGFTASVNPDGPPQIIMNLPSGPLATGQSPTAREAREASAAATDASLKKPVTFRPRASCHAAVSGTRSAESRRAEEHKVAPADVFEALHRATGLPIVADAFTRLYPPAEVSAQNRPLGAALGGVAERMRMQWKRDPARDWLQFRSASFFDDRRKEVPNRLLARWAGSRRQHEGLTLDDLIEIAGLSDAQLDGESMAEGARDCWGLAEWDLARRPNGRRHLRYLAEFTPAQRQQALAPEGLPFVRMTLAQQQKFMAIVLPGDAEGLQSLEELAGAALRVDYSRPGAWEWRPAGLSWFQWVVPSAPGQRALRPPTRAKTREEALAAARATAARYRPGMLQAVRRLNPAFDEAALEPREGQIVPTELDLQFIYVPGVSHRRAVVVARPGGNTHWATWETSIARGE